MTRFIAARRTAMVGAVTLMISTTVIAGVVVGAASRARARQPLIVHIRVWRSVSPTTARATLSRSSSHCVSASSPHRPSRRGSPIRSSRPLRASTGSSGPPG